MSSSFSLDVGFGWVVVVGLSSSGLVGVDFGRNVLKRISSSSRGVKSAMMASIVGVVEADMVVLSNALSVVLMVKKLILLA